MHKCIITTYRVKYRKRNKYKYFPERIKFLISRFLCPKFSLPRMNEPKGKKKKKRKREREKRKPFPNNYSWFERRDPVHTLLFVCRVTHIRLFALPTRAPSQPSCRSFRAGVLLPPSSPVVPSPFKIQSWHKHMVIIIDSWFSTRGVVVTLPPWLRVSLKKKKKKRADAKNRYFDANEAGKNCEAKKRRGGAVWLQDWWLCFARYKIYGGRRGIRPYPYVSTYVHGTRTCTGLGQSRARQFLFLRVRSRTPSLHVAHTHSESLTSVL